MRLKFNVFTLLLLLLGYASTAQITASSMTGFVKDESNQGLPGATVRAVHQPTGSTYGTATQIDGGYNLQNMRVGGPYRVEISYIGYETKTIDNIFLTLGEPFQLNAVMTQGGTTTLREVQVTGGRNPILNNQRTGASTNISTQQLNALPTISRSITDYTRLTPQGGSSFSTSSSLNNANTFGGRDGRYNNVQINGANVNNAFGLSSDLLPGGSAQPMSLDAIEEIQIGIAPYDVRQSNFTGANVNAVTRSGTNTYTGSAYTYWRNQTFNGRHVRDRDLPELQNRTNNIYGARVGGPIIKNKLFFFLSGEYEKSDFPGNTWVASGSGAGGNVSRTSADSLDLVANYVRNKYGYDPGPYQNYGNFQNKNTKFLVRIDWNISEKHKFFVSYNQLDASNDVLVNGTSRPAGIAANSNNRVGPGSMSFQKSNYGFEDKVKIFSAELTSNFKSNLSNQLLATYTRIQTTRTSDSDPFPFVDIARGNSTSLRSDNQMSLGYELFSYGNDLKNNTLTVIDNLTWTKGRHEVTGGLQFDYLTFGNSFLQFGTGYYRYASVQDFINDRAPIGFAYTYPFSGNSYVELNFAQAGLYIQDKVNLTKRFSLTGGIRVDMPFYLNDLPANKAIDSMMIPTGKGGERKQYSSADWPDQKPLFSPRLAFNWDATGNRNVQVRGGTGIFTGRLPFVWFTNQAGGIGTLVNTAIITDATTLNQIKFETDPNAIRNQLPGRFPSDGSNSVPSEISLVDPDFKFPQVWRTNIGTDVRLPFWGLVATAEAIYTKDINNVRQRNANLPVQAQATLNNGADTRPYWTNNRVFSNVSSGIYILENVNKGESFAFTVGLSRPARKGIFGSFYYTATFAEDVSSNPGSRASSAWQNMPNVASPNEVTLSTSQYLTPHRLVGSLSYRIEYAKHFGTTLSVFYEGASLGRFSYMYGSDVNNDGVGNDLIYIPNSAEELNWQDYTTGGQTFTKQQQIDAFNNLLETDNYLNRNRGQYAGRYGGKYPFYHRFDVRLLQDIFTNIGKRRGTLQLSVDMLNFGNFLNPNWGVQQRLTVGSGNNATLLRSTVNNTTREVTYQLQATTDISGKTVLPTSLFTDDFSTNSTWGMQLGVRLLF